MPRFELEKAKTESHRDDAPFKTKEFGVAEIHERVHGHRLLLGWVKAIRSEAKSGKWPFKKGQYNVVLETPAPEPEVGSISKSLIEHGRYRSARAALKAGIKELSKR